MQFNRTPFKSAPERAKKAPVFCVGWHAFVNWPQAAELAPSPVPLIDAAGRPVANNLADGEEVEIVSWRPRGRDSASYQIRRSTDGAEGWIGAQYLRHLRAAQ